MKICIKFLVCEIAQWVDILGSAKLKNISLCVLVSVSRATGLVLRGPCSMSSLLLPPPRKHAHEFLGRGKSRKWRDEEAWCLKIVQPAMHPGIRERNVGGISAAWKLGGLIFRRQRSSVRKARRPSYLGGSLSRLITRLFNSR